MRNAGDAGERKVQRSVEGSVGRSRRGLGTEAPTPMEGSAKGSAGGGLGGCAGEIGGGKEEGAGVWVPGRGRGGWVQGGRGGGAG